MWSIYTGKNVCEQFPTEELWKKLSTILDFNCPYKEVAQTFNPQMGYTDVWTDIDFYKEKRLHPTQKPLKLIRRLIEASSNQGDVVLDPFSGSGSTLVGCIQLNRHYIGIEMDKGYYEIGLQRIKEERNSRKSNLFGNSNWPFVKLSSLLSFKKLSVTNGLISFS